MSKSFLLKCRIKIISCSYICNDLKNLSKEQIDGILLYIYIYILEGLVKLFTRFGDKSGIYIMRGGVCKVK